MPDPWLAEALDYLTRDIDKESGKPQFIDYSELAVRHLGSIYEGLLEFHLKIADEEKAVVKEKKREIYKSVTEVKSPKEIISTGDLYLENDKHERKSTGSYYTPDYVVKYIVQNAVGPVLEENLNKVEKLFADVESLRAKARRATTAKRYLTQELSEKKRQAAEELFSLKILDPAMGSGHFLVETVDFLSDHVIKFLNEHPDNPVLEDIESLRSTILADLEKKGISIDQQRLTATNLVRRMVMKRCIYGVDLNLMAVELAKLSLWLHSFTLGAPLSFLDHHLKCGNSLMGVTEIGKVVAPGSAKEGDIKRMLQNVVAISQLTDSTATEVEESHKLYENVLKMQAPFKRRSHISTAAPLLSSITTDSLTRIEQLAESGDLSSAHPDHIATYNAALDLATKKMFFHWPLEFPDVFFSPIREQLSPGFDGVIGNPPWGAEFPSLDKTYLRKKYTPIIVRMIDSFMYFLAESLNLCKGKGFIGLVLPSPLLTQVDISKLRKKLLDETRITNLINLGDFVFGADLANPSCILITNKSHNENEHSIRILDLRHLPPPKKEHALTVQQFPYRNIPQSFYNTTHNCSFITKGFESTSLIDKLTGVSSPLKGLISGEIQRGISADYAPASIVLGRDVQEKKLEVSVCKRVITGHNVSGYLSHFSDEYIIYLARDDEIKEYPSIEKHLEAFRKEITCPEVKDGKHPWYALHRPRDPQLFMSPKLVGLTTTDRLTVAPEFSDLYAMDNLYIIHLKQQERLAYWVLLALLNSSLLSFVYRYFAQEEGRVLPQVKAENLYPLPIVNIEVTTPDRDRVVFLDKNKTLYEHCLIKNNVLSVINVVDNCLKRRPGQADVVRDLLGLLAERMGELNKQKQVETKGFLYWLEIAIGAKIDSLKNKTKIVAYHDGNLEVLVDVLNENRKVLRINPLNKEFVDQLKDAFDKNLAKLLPLKNYIATTDRLIDLIVYRLYGLTEDEIKLVESEAE